MEHSSFPILLAVLLLGALIAFGYSRGKRNNRSIYLSAFRDLEKLFRPDDRTYTNIGGLVGHHANFRFDRREPFFEIDATITLLPRHAPLYLPISKMTMKNDRLYVTLYMRYPPPCEGHLIEKGHAASRGAAITHENRLDREEVRWGELVFYLYYERMKMRELFLAFMRDNPDPRTIRHIAVTADERRAYIYLIPERGTVAGVIEPVCRFFESVFTQ